jgi:uncharacterized repeat protein (TIGR03803 family)
MRNFGYNTGCYGVCLILLFCTAVAILSPAQTFTDLASFGPPNGIVPYYGPLVQGLDGNFYGTTWDDGIYDYGTVFKITKNGTLTTLYSFLCSPTDCGSGVEPYGGLALGADGNFYGVTSLGDHSGCPHGCAFRITSDGSLTALHAFDYRQGTGPRNGLAQPNGWNLYGTAQTGGKGGVVGGTIYAVTPYGNFELLYSFCSNPTCPDGALPFSVLIKSDDGNLYGTTIAGGDQSSCGVWYGCGTVFKINVASKTLATLHSFCSQASCSDGYAPYAGLVQASDGNFYGTTMLGGISGGACPNSGCGTIFRVTPSGTLTTLYKFCSQPNCSDGVHPRATLIQATDGNLYGNTLEGGAACCGTIFRITLAGALTTLHSFSGLDGNAPFAGLVEATNGILYGTTAYGGVNGRGNVFGISVGLAPFIESLPTSGKIGSAVKILGYNLAGTTAVTFNGIAAKFAVPSDTYIEATVPTGATTGYVKVTTPKRILKSNKKFEVLK